MRKENLEITEPSGSMSGARFARDLVTSCKQHGDYLQKLQSGVDVTDRTSKKAADARVARQMEMCDQAVATGRVVTTVESQEELARLAMWQQGDASLSTADNLKKRNTLRDAPSVEEVLEAFSGMPMLASPCIPCTVRSADIAALRARHRCSMPSGS